MDSGSTNHAVYLFQKNLIMFIKKQCSTPDKIIYFSECAASRYKNRKNYINPCHHQADFGIKVERRFSATSHGKSAHDGLGGTVKRLAARASLYRPYEQQIMTQFQLYEWVRENISGIHFCFCSTGDKNIFLETQFEQTLHFFIPVSNDTLQTGIYSSDARKDHNSKLLGDMELDKVSGFVTTCSYNSQWWLGYVLVTYSGTVEIFMSLLHQPGPFRSFEYPDVPLIVTLPLADIFIKVSPNTRTGCVCTVTQTESKTTVAKFETRTP